MGGDAGLEGWQAGVPRGSLRITALPEMLDPPERPWHHALPLPFSLARLADPVPVLPLLSLTLRPEI